MKTAVFQVSEQGGAVRLVCLQVPRLWSALQLESKLIEQAGMHRNIRLLGLFDEVQNAANVDDARFLVLKPSAQHSVLEKPPSKTSWPDMIPTHEA
ncbi:MAG TPA: hypothetical protein VKZ53_01885 [Candidatus Angelobacter sp.]|nr:hypothetical protein [Candidatus Angelobacter sp.]